eukprot:5687888-Pyramimonas_sp.AAC.1
MSERSLDRLNKDADVEYATTIQAVRERWHAHENTLTHTWLQDVYEEMGAWDINRARIDEENVRRLQASHAAHAYPPMATQPSVSRYTPHVKTPDYEGKEEDLKEEEKHNWKLTDARNFEEEYWKAYKWEELD